MAMGARTASIVASATVSCALLVVACIAHARSPSDAHARSSLRLEALAALAILLGCEFYFFVMGAVPYPAHVAAGITMAAAMWVLLADPGARARRVEPVDATQAVGRPSPPGGVELWPSKSLALFYAIVGRRPLSGRFFAACIGLSLVSAANWGSSVDAPGEGGDIVLGITLVVLVPVAVLLLKTRTVIRLMSRRPSTVRCLLFVAADALVTVAILLVLAWAALRITSTRAPGLLEYSWRHISRIFHPSRGHHGGGSEWTLLATAGLASVWIWLYAASYVLSRVVVRQPRLCGRLDFLTPDMSRPLHRSGALAVVIVLVAFFGAAPCVRMAVRLLR